MVYVIEGKQKIDESPTYVELVDDTIVTILDSKTYKGDYMVSFTTTVDYYDWGKDNIKDFGKPIG